MAQSKEWSFKRKVIAATAVAMLVLFVANQRRNSAPPNIFIPPPPPLPNPNARDYFIKACDLIKDSKIMDDALPNRRNGYKILLTTKVITGLLDENQTALKTFRVGLQYPYQEPATRSSSALTPHYAKFRSMSRLLYFESKTFQMNKDWSRAMNSSLDNIELGVKVPTGGALIGCLVGIALQSIGDKSLNDTIPNLSAASAKIGAKRMLQFVDKPISLADILQEEKYTGQNTLLDVFYGKKRDGSSKFDFHDLPVLMPEMEENGKITSSEVKGIVKYFWIGKAQIVVNYTHYMDALIANSKQPFSLHIPLPELPDDPINRMFAPNFEMARDKFVENEAANAVLALNLALQAYKMDHNKYPSQLEELVPVYLNHLPADPRVLHGSFGYKREKIGYTLFSKNLK